MFQAGVAIKDISPFKPMFLFGYPHIPRTSTGIHDPLLASALCLKNDSTSLLVIALDILMISPRTANDIRSEISRKTGIAASCIMISCSHTHSGPVAVDELFCGNDPVVPKADPEYLAFLRQQAVAAAVDATACLRNAELASASATVAGAGCNRHDPHGPCDPEIGIIAVRETATGKIMALDVTYSMHPTVLHEDSTLITADFPGYVRLHLQERLGPELVTVYHTGPSGNQSPRYHVRGQTFAEAERIGRLIGDVVYHRVTGLDATAFRNQVELRGETSPVQLTPRNFPSVTEAEEILRAARDDYARLQAENAGHGPVRTAECTVFGAEEMVTMARYAQTGELQRVQREYNPVEVQVLQISDTCMAGFPGEVFVEFGLALKRQFPGRVIPVSLVNGELQGYIVTPDAVGYEAGNSMFTPESGSRMTAALGGMISRFIGGAMK